MPTNKLLGARVSHLGSGLQQNGSHVPCCPSASLLPAWESDSLTVGSCCESPHPQRVMRKGSLLSQAISSETLPCCLRRKSLNSSWSPCQLFLSVCLSLALTALIINSLVTVISISVLLNPLPPTHPPTVSKSGQHFTVHEVFW